VSKAKDAPSAPPAEIIPPRKTSRARAALSKLGIASAEEAEKRDHELEGLMSEIEADLREDELRRIWQQYGKAIIAAAVVVLLGVAGFELWRDHAEKQRLAVAERYDQGVKDVQAGKADDALAIFTDIGKNGRGGFAALAQLQRAAILLQKKDVDGAIAAYKALAADSKADGTLRDLALLLQALHSTDRMAPKDVEALIAPLLDDGNPFRPSALEISALMAAKQGDISRAAKTVNEIVSDTNAPQGVRARARDLAAYYKAVLAQQAAPTPPKS
jgi:hypothetical protein